MRSLAALALLLLLAAPATAQFRGDEIEPRKYKMNDDHFISIFSYRSRLTYRWQWGDAGLAHRRWWWSSPAVGYDITAGSLTNDDLYVSQQAIVRLPFSDHLTGEYRFVEEEDLDQRYERSEVEVLVRLLRPDLRLPLTDTIGRTPDDGLFFGGLGVLDGFKENVDIGLVLGWRGERLAVRVDAIRPDFFYNGKAELQSEYTSDPLTLRTRLGALLLDGDLELLAWLADDLPFRLTFPIPDDVSFRRHRLHGGFGARWRAAPGVRADLEVSASRTRSGRRSTRVPGLSYDLERDHLSIYAAAEVDVAPLFESSSRPVDSLLFGATVQALDEHLDDISRPGEENVLRRGEGYLEVGYLAGIPSPGPDYLFALRLTTQHGFLSLRDIRTDELRHRVSQRYLGKIGLGLECSFRDDLAMAFFQLTYRVDDQTFGGFNAQVQMRF